MQKGQSRWVKRAAKAFEVISTIIMQRGKFSTESSPLDCLLPAILGGRVALASTWRKVPAVG